MDRYLANWQRQEVGGWRAPCPEAQRVAKGNRRDLVWNIVAGVLALPVLILAAYIILAITPAQNSAECDLLREEVSEQPATPAD